MEKKTRSKCLLIARLYTLYSYRFIHLSIFLYLIFFPTLYSIASNIDIPLRFPEDSKKINDIEWRMDSDILEILSSNSLKFKARDILEYTGEPKNVTLVLQGEFSILSEIADRQAILSSLGAGPCVIVVLHDERKKIIGLGHIDAYTEVDTSLDLMISKFVSKNSFPTSAKLFSLIPENKTLRNILFHLSKIKVPVTKFSRQMDIAVNIHGELFDSGNLYFKSPDLEERLDRLDEFINKIMKRINDLAKEENNCLDYDCLKEHIYSEFHRPLIELKLNH